MASINIFFHKYNSKFTKLSKAFSFILYFVLTSEFLKLLYPLRLLKLQKKSWYHERCPSSVTVCGPLQGIWPFVKSSLVACWKVFDCASNARCGSSQGILTCSKWSLVGILSCFKWLVVARFTAYDRVLNARCKEFNRCQSKYSPGCHLQSYVMFTLWIKLKYWWLDVEQQPNKHYRWLQFDRFLVLEYHRVKVIFHPVMLMFPYWGYLHISFSMIHENVLHPKVSSHISLFHSNLMVIIAIKMAFQTSCRCGSK